MMYTLDLSGHDDDGRAGVDRFGGRFMTIEDAESHGRMAVESDRFVFKPSTLWVRDEENNVVRHCDLAAIAEEGDRIAYAVTITSTDGLKSRFACGGASDQEALIYAGKVVEGNADVSDPQASVTITKNGKAFGPAATVAEFAEAYSTKSA